MAGAASSCASHAALSQTVPSTRRPFRLASEVSAPEQSIPIARAKICGKPEARFGPYRQRLLHPAFERSQRSRSACSPPRFNAPPDEGRVETCRHSRKAQQKSILPALRQMILLTHDLTDAAQIGGNLDRHGINGHGFVGRPGDHCFSQRPRRQFRQQPRLDGQIRSQPRFQKPRN